MRAEQAVCGTDSCYNKGCRCAECKAAHAAYAAAYRRARAAPPAPRSQIKATELAMRGRAALRHNPTLDPPSCSTLATYVADDLAMADAEGYSPAFRAWLRRRAQKAKVR